MDYLDKAGCVAWQVRSHLSIKKCWLSQSFVFLSLGHAAKRRHVLLFRCITSAISELSNHILKINADSLLKVYTQQQDNPHGKECPWINRPKKPEVTFFNTFWSHFLQMLIAFLNCGFGTQIKIYKYHKLNWFRILVILGKESKAVSWDITF